jgi:hypothetical protein
MKMLGKLYEEVILSLGEEALEWRTPDGYADRFILDKDLHGWFLRCENKNRPSRSFQTRCNSEEEARYLKMFFEAGLQRIRIPKDETYLKNIVPRIERLYLANKEALEEHTEGILNRSEREAVRSAVWVDVLKQCHDDNDRWEKEHEGEEEDSDDMAEEKMEETGKLDGGMAVTG